MPRTKLEKVEMLKKIIFREVSTGRRYLWLFSKISKLNEPTRGAIPLFLLVGALWLKKGPDSFTCIDFTQKNYIKKNLHDPDNHDGVITHLEPHTLECEVKWALGSITTNKASGGDGIPVELFQTLEDDAVKVLHSICQQVWKTQQWPQDWKMSVFIPIPKKANAKACSNYCTIALISHASTAQNSPGQALAIRELWTPWCSSWF